ncbi:hypothetical protein HHK36_016190 [Tetracentron sinense]|uniref:Myb-like domain-containing protein n=1 Tax=Tetracentron sinense TaxID=13715 RepID=A0A835DDZ4_TETSI|nr:hypothetical protein HHK36_016190 [Tetracentron sinense]
MEGHHLHSSNIDTGDRIPQWSIQETKELLTIRTELDQTFMETKRNKILWEVISSKMKEKDYNRSADQCKCKWKNLVTRYKGCETIAPENVRQQFQFYNELQAIFAARMQRMLWIEAESGASGSSKKKGEILEVFSRQQMQMEVQWREIAKARKEERRLKEMEWRQAMDALEKERLLMDRRWKEREEQRRIRGEARAEKRDALITALLNKLKREDMVSVEVEWRGSFSLKGNSRAYPYRFICEGIVSESLVNFNFWDMLTLE